MPARTGGTFELTTTMLSTTARTTRSLGITSIGLMQYALAHSGGGTSTTSSTAGAAADRLPTAINLWASPFERNVAGRHLVPHCWCGDGDVDARRAIR